jgi:hypothetical protein
MTAPMPSRALREYAVSMTRPTTRTNTASAPIGEWIGEVRKGQRGQRNDALVALAEFVHGTITPGCGCEECDARRETVMTLVYGVGVDGEAIDRAITD